MAARRAGPAIAVALAALAASGCLRRGDGALDARGPSPAAAAATGAVRASLTLPPHLRGQGDSGAPPRLAAQAPQPAAASPEATGSLPRPEPARARKPARTVRLTEAVLGAVSGYPEIKAFEARTREAKAGIGVARSALLPTVETRIAAGPNFSGAFEGTTVPYDAARSSNLDGRFDAGVTLRQLLYDFGAARSDVARAELTRDAETMKLRDKIDEIAGKTAQTYLRVLETRALLSLVDDIIAAHEQLARVIEAHAREGHGTIADVQRVSSRIVDVRAIRADVSLQQKAAEDQFERLTGITPGKLVAPPNLRARLPRDSHGAIAQMLAGNPRLAALQSSTRATQAELESQKASTLPRINLEVESETKNFRNGPAGRMQAEGRAMVAMRYKLLDGGLSAATQAQILARMEGGQFLYLNEREQIEQDIRQAYRAIDSAGRKLKLVSAGVESARKVRELYLEQFKGGKRTVFELLDSQMSFFTIRRSQIESQYEAERAVYEILRATGKLTETLSTARQG